MNTDVSEMSQLSDYCEVGRSVRNTGTRLRNCMMSHCSLIHIATFEGISAVLLITHFYRDVWLCRWVRRSRRFDESYYFQLWSRSMQQDEGNKIFGNVGN